MAHRTARGFAILALTALGACGGSGGGGSPVVVAIGDGTFNGDYFAVFKLGGHMPGPRARGTTGILLADGAGAAVHSQVVNDGATVSAPTTTDYSYDVAADGTLALTVAGTEFLRGGIATDGHCALVGTVLPGAFPGILVLLRRQGFYDDASLSGAYHFVEFLFGALGGRSAAGTGSAVFDGTGGGTVTVTFNSMGGISPVLSGPLTYSVIADGTSSTTIGSADREGGVAAGGRAAVWGGSTTSGEAPVMSVVVKEATSAGLATLQGAYWMVLLERNPGSDDFRSLSGTATSNGAGSLTLLATSNTEGVIAAEPLQTTTYTVTANGKLTVDAGGSVLVGGVSQDGSFAVVGGGTAAGTNPMIVLLCRK